MLATRTYAPRFWLLCVGFVICGIVTVLPGPLLPLLAARWGLPDVQSGGFFAAEFAASTVGAVFSPWRLHRSLPGGFAFMAAGVALLDVAAAGTNAATGHPLALMAFALIGFGTGLSVTATNLTAGAASAGRGRRLSIVNLWWGMGAVACPWVIAAAERSHRMRPLLLLLALAALGMFAAFAPLLRVPAGPSPRARATASSQFGTLAFFALFLFLYVGVENAVGGWIATYAHRFSGFTLADSSLTVSIYWMALLAGRGLTSLALRKFSESAVLVPGLVLALAAVAALIQPHATATVLVAVVAAGIGFGPVFPLGVARLLARLSDHRRTGWVFAMCAGGGAVLPWLTGLVSTASASLRVGFAVPVAALAAILVLALVENAVLRKPEPAQHPLTP
ncbi:MAG TPA: MFS transporter [Acidobacteriaceae bacterium]|nr:MFS transporter [Acidobacteriaceae bacterium]